MPPIPILLDTDIGTDIDDAYALIFAAVSRELHLRAVTIVNNDVLLRGKIAKRILRHLGRDDIPVALGESRSLTTGVTRGWLGIEGRGIDLSGVHEVRDFAPYDAAKMIAGCARDAHECGDPLAIVTIGGLTNLAVAMNCYPDRIRLARNIICMASTFEGTGPENARAEHNVACDPEAMSRVLMFGLPVTLVGLNVTRETRMDSADLERIEAQGGPLANSLAGMHGEWFQHIGREHSPMHDALAVCAAFTHDLLKYRSVKATMNPPSPTIEFNEPALGEVTCIRAAESVDENKFHSLFFDRVHKAVAVPR